MKFLNYSCGLLNFIPDSNNLLEAWFSCHLNETHPATFICFVKFILYQIVYFIEALYIALSVNHTHTSIVAL
jgi:hypothetical protein